MSAIFSGLRQFWHQPEYLPRNKQIKQNKTPNLAIHTVVYIFHRPDVTGRRLTLAEKWHAVKVGGAYRCGACERTQGKGDEDQVCMKHPAVKKKRKGECMAEAAIKNARTTTIVAGREGCLFHSRIGRKEGRKKSATNKATSKRKNDSPANTSVPCDPCRPLTKLPTVVGGGVASARAGEQCGSEGRLVEPPRGQHTHSLCRRNTGLDGLASDGLHGKLKRKGMIIYIHLCTWIRKSTHAKLKLRGGGLEYPETKKGMESVWRKAETAMVKRGETILLCQMQYWQSEKKKEK